MKKLLFIMCILLIVGGCTENYSKIVPEKPINGTTVNIDSTQWIPVMMQVGDDILIYNGMEIKKVIIWEPVTIFFIALLFGVLIGVFIGVGFRD